MNRSVILSRQLALVVYIERHPGITVEQLAQHFGLKPKLIRDDIEVLDRAGFGDLLPDRTFELNMDRYLEAGELEVYSNLQVKSAPRLTSREAAVLLMGLRAIAPGLNAEQSEVIPALMAEVLALAGGEGSEALNLSQVVESNLPGRSWQVLENAIRERRQVRIDYVSSAGRQSTRRIDPLRLEREELAWLLRAWCYEAEELRTFRVDRIVGIESLDTPQEHAETQGRAAGDDCFVTLRESARWRLGEIPATEIDREGDDPRARFEVWDRQWMIGRLLAMSSDVLATEPAEWQVAAGDRARQALAVWSELPVVDEGSRGDER